LLALLILLAAIITIMLLALTATKNPILLLILVPLLTVVLMAWSMSAITARTESVVVTITPQQPPMTPPSFHRHHVGLKACWASIDASLTIIDNNVEARYKISVPNPCYRILSVASKNEEKNGELLLYLELTGTSPPSNTYCIQVVPPPLEHMEFIGLTHPVKKIHLHIKLLDKQTGKTCNATATITVK